MPHICVCIYPCHFHANVSQNYFCSKTSFLDSALTQVCDHSVVPTILQHLTILLLTFYTYIAKVLLAVAYEQRKQNGIKDNAQD